MNVQQPQQSLIPAAVPPYSPPMGPPPPYSVEPMAQGPIYHQGMPESAGVFPQMVLPIPQDVNHTVMTPEQREELEKERRRRRMGVSIGMHVAGVPHASLISLGMRLGDRVNRNAEEEMCGGSSRRETRREDRRERREERRERREERREERRSRRSC